MTGCDGICYLVAAAYVNCPLIGKGRCGRSIVFFGWSCGCCQSGGQHEQHRWQHRQNPAGCRRHPLVLPATVPIHLQKRFRLNWGETFTHTHTHSHTRCNTLATQKNAKEEAAVETLWLGRGFIQGHKVSIVFLLLYLCVWQKFNESENLKKYNSLKVRLRQVALVHRMPSRNWSRHVRKKKRRTSREISRASRAFPPLFSQWPLCCDTCAQPWRFSSSSSYSPWHFSYHLVFYLFGFSFQLPFIFFSASISFSSPRFLTHTRNVSSFFRWGCIDHHQQKRKRDTRGKHSKKVVYLCVCCCWK